MAKASWLTTNPNSGSGNGTIINSATVHTGRNVRETTVTVTGVGVSSPKTYKVTQKAKPEFVNFTDGTEKASSKSGGALLVTGKSNSKSLTYSWVGNAYGVSLPKNYEANGLSTINGSPISGDPGATAEYDSQISLQIPPNETVEEIVRVLKVVTENGESALISIRQSIGDATLSISPTSITLEPDGSAVSVTVTSNTSWTVS